MQDKTILLGTTSAGTGIKINRKKTELMKMNTTANIPVTVGGEPIREVESFVYLGSMADQQGYGPRHHSQHRQGKNSYRHAQTHLSIWRSQHENQTPHFQIQCEVNSVLRCETWRITQTMQQKPWPGTRRGRESKASLAAVGGETLKQSWRNKGPTGLEWPEQHRTECDDQGS